MYDPGMDVLGDVVNTMQTGPSTSARAELRAPWGLRFPADGGAMFHVTLQGNAWLISDAVDAPVPLGPGDVVLVPRGAGHVLADRPNTPPVDFEPVDALDQPPELPFAPDGGARTLLLCGTYHVERLRPHPLLVALPEVIHVRADPARNHSLRAATALLAEEVDAAGPGASSVVAALVEAMFPLILRAWIDGNPDCESGAAWINIFDDPAVSSGIQAIHSDPAHPWTVADLAQQAGLSRAAFARRFSRVTGEPPLTYLTRWRMILAGRLLGQPGRSIAEVAGAVGYSSEFAFAKAFKRDYGIGPGAYRRQAVAA